METTEINNDIGQVYLLWNDINEDTYVGSTFTTLKRRLRIHKNCSTSTKGRSYNQLVYQKMREIGNSHWFMKRLELVESCNKTELVIKEREWIEKLKPTLNVFNSYLSKEERKAYVQNWANEHKEHLTKYKAEHYLKNKEKYKENCKKYYAEHKEELIKKASEWTKNNNPKVQCECGIELLKKGLSSHRKTKRHLKLMEASSCEASSSEQQARRALASNSSDELQQHGK